MHRLEMGDRFYHVQERDRYGEPRLCVVTQVAPCKIQWRFESGKALHWFRPEHAAKHILRIIPNND